MGRQPSQAIAPGTCRLRVGSHGSIESRLPMWRMWDGIHTIADAGEQAGPTYAVTMDSRTESSALAVAA